MERYFDEELGRLKDDMRHMGDLVAEAVYRSVEALKGQDKPMAKKVIDDDKSIDEAELAIDEECLDLLALRQPVAGDLRFISMAMKIATDLERMADLAVDIAQRVVELGDQPLVKPLVDIPRLTTLAQTMTREAIGSFIASDMDLATKVILMDNEADRLRDRIQKDLIEDYMLKDPATIRGAVPLLLVARHLERICDHATNIAEDTIYRVKAKVVKHHPEKLNNNNGNK
ncbi:MAG: phosphate signaling complex protein PhoU [Candidatus Omnitrophota bacterium]|jgi:phosphate transport system protein|nr:phosphate signaling complex protein PhoU [Candidatus Omnitrophota bacterium]